MFIAIPVPESVRDSLHAALASYRRAFDRVRWLDPATWHVTLLFLGCVPVAAVAPLIAASDGVAARWPPFEVDTVGGGGRVRGRDGPAWLWVRRNARGVVELAEDLEWAVVRGVPGVPAPRRAPSSHVTIARRADGTLLSSLRQETHGPLRSGWHVDRIVIMRSYLGSAGAHYEAIHEAPLTGRTTP
jgi:2'-5' RNA ligase